MSGLAPLSTVIWLPILAGVAVLFTGSDRNANFARWLALAGAVAGFVVVLPLYVNFDSSVQGMQFVELTPWIESYNINYHLGIDGISLLLILTNFYHFSERSSRLHSVAAFRDDRFPYRVFDKSDDELVLLS